MKDKAEVVYWYCWYPLDESTESHFRVELKLKPLDIEEEEMDAVSSTNYWEQYSLWNPWDNTHSIYLIDEKNFLGNFPLLE